jgi:diadenylate cyclase
MDHALAELLNQFYFLIQRLNWLSIIDVLLVTIVFFVILMLVRDTQAMVLLRGVVVLVLFLVFITTLINLPAFSWLVNAAIPALFFAIPVIFAPEIRRALERLGRAGSGPLFWQQSIPLAQVQEATIKTVVNAAARLSSRQHGALIVLQRSDNLHEYTQTGVRIDSRVTTELLLQIFYPNTPLHDGAVIIGGGRLLAAACVMPLSASGILLRTPDRQMGLRHRAALGISEASDAIAVVVSEETGSISVAHTGRLIRRLDTERLENILLTFYRSTEKQLTPSTFIERLRQFADSSSRMED